MADHLVQGDDKRVYADAGYIGMGKRLGEEKDAEGFRCCIAAKRAGIKKRESGERAPSEDRASQDQHPPRVFKNLFGYRKARHKELGEHQAQLFSLFRLAI